jgi:L-fuconolactonase
MRRSQDEQPIEPSLPIVDPHMHMWDLSPAPGARRAMQGVALPAMFEAIAQSGHSVTHTVFLECHAMYRLDGPPELRPVGEVEFANAIAAMGDSGNYGACRVAHRIVGSADPLLGEQIRPVLEAHLAAGGERFRGMRFATYFSEGGMFGRSCDPRNRGLMRDPRLRQTAHILAAMDLSLDVWCFHSQLDELIDLATALPDLTIILDHIGTPEKLGVYAGLEDEVRCEWFGKLVDLARRPNVVIKLGGLGMDLTGSGFPPASSEVLAARWRPYIEDCIEAFTPQRSMFESNFPPDSSAGSYGAVWNAFKRIAAGASADEKAALFSGTASRIYRISA